MNNRSSEFEPYVNESKKSEFSVWEFNGQEAEQQIEITEQEALITECELLKQEAFANGYAEGMQQAQAEITAQKAQLTKWIELLQKPIQLLDDKLTQEILETVIWLCKYCIGVELSVDQSKLKALLDEIKTELPSLRGNKQFAMHPDDVAWVKAEIDEKAIPGLHEILVADSALERGDFYLKGEHCELDGRIHTRFITLFAKHIDKDTIITPVKSQD